MHRSFMVGASLAMAFAAGAMAEPITFVHTGTGSGTLNGAPFGPAAFTITSEADTLNRQTIFTNVYYIDHDTSEIRIDGLGTFQFVSATRTFINGQLVGFSRGGINGLDLFNGPNSAVLAGWDMLSAVGPAAGTGGLLQWTSGDVITSGGTLIFNNGQSAATFEAIIGGGGCYADCDTSTGPGVLDIFDFLCFGNRFAAGDPYACDCDTSTGLGVCDIFDFLCFGNEFNNGCP